MAAQITKAPDALSGMNTGLENATGDGEVKAEDASEDETTHGNVDAEHDIPNGPVQDDTRSRINFKAEDEEEHDSAEEVEDENANEDEDEHEGGDEDELASAVEDAASGSDEDGYDDDWDVRKQLNAISDITRTGTFYSYTQPPTKAPNPGLEIEGLRRFGMPLNEHDVQAIIAVSHRAPYGKGSETLVNEAVRKTWEIDANRIKLRHPDWPADLNNMLAMTCVRLGVTGGVNVVEAQLYKLLVYEEGAMFKQHKDSEKAPRMFGTTLWSHSEWTTTCLAWYADVLHSVEPVTSGYRVVLTYNLVAKGLQPPPSLRSLQMHIDQVKQTLRRWRRIDSPKFLVYNLEHDYTNASIRARDLKGTDVHRIRTLMALRKELGIRLFLATVEKSVSGTCEEPFKDRYSGRWGRRRGWYDIFESEEEDEEEGHTIDEELESSLELTSIVDLNGNVVARNIGLVQDEHIVQIGHFDDRTPDDEDYEGHTGNAGAQATHWYRNMAVVIVPDENWIDFILHGPSGLLKDFLSMLLAAIDKLETNPAEDQVRARCAKRCQVVLDKHSWYGDRDSFFHILKGCTAVGRKDLAEKAVTAGPRMNAQELLEVAEKCNPVGWDDLAAAAICSHRCRDAREWLAILNYCKSIQDNALLECFVTESPCNDEPTFLAMFNCCMDMKRVDLATQAVQKYQESSAAKVNRSYLQVGRYPRHRSAVDFRKVVLPLVTTHSADYTFEDWRPCLDILFRGYGTFADYHRALKDLADTWTYHDTQESSSFDAWKRTCCERTLEQSSALGMDDAQVVREMISVEGNSWVTDWLLPLAIRKSTEGDIAVALSLWRVLPDQEIDRALTVQTLSALTPSVISGISLPGITNYADNLIFFWWCLVTYSLAAEALNFELKLFHILGKIANVSFNHPVWFSALLEAHIVRVVDFEPEQPSQWTPAPRTGCGRCAECRMLNDFLADPRRVRAHFARPKHIRTHLESFFQPQVQTGFGQTPDGRFSWQILTRGSPHQLEITKRSPLFSEFEEQHAAWLKRASVMMQTIVSLAPEPRLRMLLGTSYDLFVNMRIVTLQRSAMGVPISGTYQAPLPSAMQGTLAAAPISNGGATPVAPGPSTSPNMNGAKRAAPGDPTEDSA